MARPVRITALAPLPIRREASWDHDTTVDHVIAHWDRWLEIESTLAMDRIWVSENLLDQVRKYEDMEILGEPQTLVFNENDDLF